MMNINISYDEELKELFIAEECSSGCLYIDVEQEDIGNYVKEYVDGLFSIEE